MDAAAQDPITAWQEVHTFTCPHGQGVITPEACAELRQRNDLSKAHGITPQGKEKRFRPGACARCTEYQAHWDDVAARRAGRDKTHQPKETDMKTLIDCLYCGQEDVPNLARGLCKTCYPKLSPEQRKSYSLDEARKRREVRLEQRMTFGPDGELRSVGHGREPEEDPGLEARAESTRESREKEMEARVQEAQAEDSEDPLSGFEFVPCSNAQLRSLEVHVDGPGKFLRFGAKIAQELGIRAGAHVHLYRGNKGLALKFLSEPDRTSYRLSQDGSAHKGHQNKVVLSARKLVKDGIVFPGQRFEARPHESGRIVYLDAIEESSQA